MSETHRNAEAQLFGCMRNILFGVGFLFLPIATLIEVFFPGPSNMHTGMIVFFVVVGLLFFALGGFLEAHRRKALNAPDEPEAPSAPDAVETLKAEHDVAAQEDPQPGSTIRLIDLLVIIAIFLSFSIGLVLFGTAFSQGTLADRFASEAQTYDMRSAQPADEMLKALGFEATRAVQVTPVADARGFPVICALNTEGELDLYKVQLEGQTSKVNKFTMGETLRTAAEPFCDAAFVRANGAPSVSE